MTQYRQRSNSRKRSGSIHSGQKKSLSIKKSASSTAKGTKATNAVTNPMREYSIDSGASKSTAFGELSPESNKMEVEDQEIEDSAYDSGSDTDNDVATMSTRVWAVCTMISASLSVTMQSCFADMCMVVSDSYTFRHGLSMMLILLRRSWLSLWRRPQLFWGIIITQILIALVLGIIVGDASGSVYNLVSFFAVGSLLVMLSGAQLIAYLFDFNQQFLKENSRGMYSSLTYCAVASLPIYILRVAGIVAYCAITFTMLNLKDDTANNEITAYYYSCMVTLILATTMMAEAVIYIVPGIREAIYSSQLCPFPNFCLVASC